MTTTAWTGTATAITSIAHGGQQHGTINLLRREVVLAPDGSRKHIPMISGNALRGRLRRIGEEMLRDTLGYATRAAEARRACGKDTGTVRLADGDYTVVADLPKRVDWSQEKLAQIARNIAESCEDPAEFIETTLKVSERKYTALPESWRKGFEPARTVRTGKPKFRLLLGEEVR